MGNKGTNLLLTGPIFRNTCFNWGCSVRPPALVISLPLRRSKHRPGTREVADAGRPDGLRYRAQGIAAERRGIQGEGRSPGWYSHGPPSLSTRQVETHLGLC